MISAFFGLLVAPLAGQAEYPVAGVNPDQRPRGAPHIDTVDRNDQWYAMSLAGVSKPYPTSLGFLEDQGNWYTPFNRPGMSGRYDIRGWHYVD